MSFSRSWRGCCQQEGEDFKDHKTGGGSPAEGIATMCWHRLPSRAGSLCRHWLALCSTLVCNIWTGSLIKTELPILQLTNYKQGLSAGLCCKLDGSAPVGGWQEGLENCSLEKRQLFRNDCKLIEKANSLIIVLIIIVLIIIVTKNFHQYWCIFLTLIRVRCKTVLPSCHFCLKGANCCPVYLVKFQTQTGTTIAANHTRSLDTWRWPDKLKLSYQR